MRKVVSAASAGLIVAGCASKASDVAPSYVSPMQYDAYNCEQPAEGAQRISAHATEAAGAQESQATRDAVATTAAIVAFWPAAFFVGGDKQNAAELARLRGEMDGIEQTSIRKNMEFNSDKLRRRTHLRPRINSPTVRLVRRNHGRLPAQARAKLERSVRRAMPGFGEGGLSCPRRSLRFAISDCGKQIAAFSVAP